MINIFGILGATFLLASAGIAQPYTVKASITEFRSSNPLVGNSGDDMIVGPIKVVIEVTGLDSRQVHYFGQWKFMEAEDDKGTDLMAGWPKEKKGLKKFDHFGEEAGTSHLEFSLNQSKRQAMKIVRLRGEFSVIEGGQPKVIGFPNLKALMGTTLHNPTLHALGLQTQVLPHDAANNFFALKYRGNDKLLDRGRDVVEVVDSDGKIVTDRGIIDETDRSLVVFNLTRPLDNSMKLR